MTSSTTVIGSIKDSGGGNGYSLVEAVKCALARAMQDDESVLVMGQDVGVNGGVFRATDGLHATFGSGRVVDMPLDENTIAGIAVGMSMRGLRPVAEIQFSGFAGPCIDQMMCHAARMRNRTRGRITCPMVLRAPYGGGIHAPEHHSESMEALFAHIPGLRMVVPSSPEMAYRLLLAAVQNPDPVVFFEPKREYRTKREAFEDDGVALPLDTCFVVREGEDVTLVSWGAMMSETLDAAEELVASGIDPEVIDVATLKYVDMPTIMTSVSKTGRCVIVHEAPQMGGVGGEIAASIVGDDGVFNILGPVKRVAGYDTIMPLARTEKYYLDFQPRIITAVQELMECK